MHHVLASTANTPNVPPPTSGHPGGRHSEGLQSLGNARIQSRPIVQEEEEASSFVPGYTKGMALGIGGFSRVFVGIHNETGKSFAIKQVDCKKAGSEMMNDEISTLEALKDGPNIIQLFHVHEGPKHCYLVTELMEGGNLLSYIMDKTTFSEKEASDVGKCMFTALHYMHSRRIVHRDVKPENLLLQKKGDFTQVKLADFGFAKKVKTTNGCRTLCGTHGYMAPEMLGFMPAYDTKCDLFSAGVVLFLLLGGYLPFGDDSDADLSERTRQGQYAFHREYWSSVSASAKELITFLLKVNPSERASALVALGHPWIRQLDSEPVPNDTIMPNSSTLVEPAMDRNQTLRDVLESTSSTVALPPGQRRASVSSFGDSYSVGDLLAIGDFGTIRRCRQKTTGEFATVKIIATPVDGEPVDEIEALKRLRGGPGIIRLLHVYNHGRFTCIAMEHKAGGELLRSIANKEAYTERDARSICKILISAVNYCHKKKMAHRDLKPESLILTDKNNVTSLKITNFGLAKRVTKPNCLRTICGTTAAYVAPEVMHWKSKGYDQRADMWSVGAIVYVLLGGSAPFEGSIEKLAKRIFRGKYKFDDKYWKNTSMYAKDLISSCLQVNPNLRVTAEEALQSEWMTVEDESLVGNDLSVPQKRMRRALVSPGTGGRSQCNNPQQG